MSAPVIELVNVTAYSRDSTSNVIVKLLGFTFAMVVLPIGSYFLTVNTIFKGPYWTR